MPRLVTGARVTLAATALLGSLGSGGAAQAQSRGVPTVSVGRITSAQTCTVYQQSAGRAAVVATPSMVAAASSWRTWLVRDCVDNFRSIRLSLEAALAGSGRLSVRPAGGFVVTGRISEVSEGGPAPATPDPRGVGDFSVASSYMVVNMDLTVRDATGRIVFGGLLTKKLETGSDIKVDGFRAQSSQDGAALYTQLQHEVALAAARMISLRLAPMHVVSGDGREIQLDYGAPLLALGTMLHVTSPDGATTIRYNVTSARQGTATAEIDGGGDASEIGPGSTAIIIEPEDPAANARRFKRVDLP